MRPCKLSVSILTLAQPLKGRLQPQLACPLGRHILYRALCPFKSLGIAPAQRSHDGGRRIDLDGPLVLSPFSSWDGGSQVGLSKAARDTNTSVSPQPERTNTGQNQRDCWYFKIHHCKAFPPVSSDLIPTVLLALSILRAITPYTIFILILLAKESTQPCLLPTTRTRVSRLA